MPTFNVEKAIKSGKTENEILDYLSSINPKFNTEEALKSKSSREIINYLAAINTGPKKDYDFSWGNTVKNIPSSGLNAVKDIYQVIRHPQQTKNALTGLMSGVISKVIPGKQESEEYANLAWDYAVKRYGGVENLQKTIESDPIGVAMDVASVFSGVGGTAKTGAAILPKTQKLNTITKGLEKVGDIAGKIGVATDPSILAGKGLKIAGSKITGSLPPIIYKHAAGLPTDMPIKKRIAAVETALEEGIPLSHNGMDKLWSKINNIDKKVSEIIDTGAFETASIEQMNTHIDEVISFYEDVPGSTKEIKYLEKLKQNNIKQFGKDIPAPRAHVMKKKVYKQLREAYERQTPVRIIKEKGQMATAKGAMAELERLFPEIKTLNKKESEYLNLFSAIKKSVPRIANQKYGIFNPFNLTVGGTVGYATQSAPMAIGALGTFLIIKNPVVQSHIAIILRKSNKYGGKIAKQIPASTGKVMVQAGRTDDWSNYDKLQ